ncbi:Ras family protein [Trichomonas vaginalis G3]|uniref:Ras family protein n=1 Tax=Trichomonas vaginalis (strain ATCC PRA-98 / G3) TaxID=412133 RepID=A2DYZ8_TRIV3|nr:GTPase protein [Trichomonas vaginalis G3]EAY14409.1 Ras family protein [Trichomonas vaginalis G3]KAI5501232.1 GTPase protein [Trichomonas vaginalis G3]|eukprot:XP_001326632.1 Ras family protein [Trichomonas vaginalis G3]
MKTVLRDLLSSGHKIIKGAVSIDPDDVPLQKLKLIICGDEKSGKSKLFDRIIKDTYTENYFQTIGSDFEKTNRVVPGANVELEVWDTAGSPQYRSILPIFFNNADIVIVVFDVTSRKTFEAIPGFITDARNWVNNDCDIAVFGTKIDSWKNKREVEFEEADQLTKRFDTRYFETSAVTTQGLEDAIRKLLKHALKRKRLLPEWLLSTPRDGNESDDD